MILFLKHLPVIPFIYVFFLETVLEFAKESFNMISVWILTLGEPPRGM